MAWADWAVPGERPNHFHWYFGAYLQFSDVGEPRPFATIGSGFCVKEQQKHGFSVSCRGRGERLDKKEWDFSMDPTLSSARLVVTKDGDRHRVGWTAREPVPGMFTAWSECESQEVAAGGGLHRDTRAVGRLYDHKFVPHGWLDWSFLMSGGMADACPTYASLADRLAEGKTITLVRTFSR